MTIQDIFMYVSVYSWKDITMTKLVDVINIDYSTDMLFSNIKCIKPFFFKLLTLNNSKLHLSQWNNWNKWKWGCDIKTIEVVAMRAHCILAAHSINIAIFMKSNVNHYFEE